MRSTRLSIIATAAIAVAILAATFAAPAVDVADAPEPVAAAVGYVTIAGADAASLRCGTFPNGNPWGCGRVAAAWQNGRNVTVKDMGHGSQCIRVRLQRKSTGAWSDMGVNHCGNYYATFSVSLSTEVSGVRMYYGFSQYRTLE